MGCCLESVSFEFETDVSLVVIAAKSKIQTAINAAAKKVRGLDVFISVYRSFDSTMLFG